jgi:signal transduction protein with GAF and PtsI domain
MDWQIDLLLNAGLLVGKAHEKQRLIGVRGIALARLITVALLRVQRLPGKRQTEPRRVDQFRVLLQHAADVAGAP